VATRTKIGAKVRREVLERDGPNCRYCGKGPLRFGWAYNGKWRLRLVLWDVHLDHVVPLARGGTNTPENLVVSCDDCNARKFIGPAPPMLPSTPVCVLPFRNGEEMWSPSPLGFIGDAV
jgi:5-methylcytosine-specific restriction endonuclease McrA